MLPRWFKRLQQDELQVLMHPQRLTLLRIQRTVRHYFKPIVIANSVIDIDQEAINNAKSASNTEPWTHAITTLGEALKHKEWQGTAANVTLSNHFVRYATIPWNEHLSKPAEHQAYVSHCFNLVFGEQIKNWHLQAAAAAYGKASVASAIPQAMLTALHQTLQSANVAMHAVTPQLIPAINQCLTQLNKPLGKNQRIFSANNLHAVYCLVMIQQDRLCIALLENGDWLSVKNVTLDTDVSAQVSALIQRETIHHNMLTKPTVLLYWPEHPNQSLNLQAHTVIKVQALQARTTGTKPLAHTNWEIA